MTGLGLGSGLAAEDLRVTFPGGVQAVAGASLALARGETVGLVGESGSGKTTLARALVGLARPSGGRVLLDGRDLAALAPAEARALRRRVQMIFQDPLSSLSPRFTLGRLLEEPLAIHGLDRAEGRAAIRSLLERLGLPEAALGKFPHQVSGGQARRVAIARALVLRPAFLVADEPTAGLDLSVQGDLLNLLADLGEGYGLGLLLVSHNLDVVGRVTGRMAVMYLGRIVEEGPTRAVFARPRHPYTAALLSANPAVNPARRRPRVVLAGDIPSPARPPSGCRFHTRCPQARDRCRVDDPALGPEAGPAGPSHRAACHFPL